MIDISDNLGFYTFRTSSKHAAGQRSAGLDMDVWLEVLPSVLSEVLFCFVLFCFVFPLTTGEVTGPALNVRDPPWGAC